MWIKICANTNLADAQLAASLGADAVGFVFAPSKRQVSPPQVAQITAQLPPEVEKVGVFSTYDPGEVLGCVASAGLTAAQIHRGFDASLLRTLAARSAEQFPGSAGRDLRLIQMVAYEVDAAERATADRRFEAELSGALAEPAIWAVLIDAARSGASGGLGLAFDWTHAATIINRVLAAHSTPGGSQPRIILAGGLRPENVAAAITALKPWGIDVASGVEAEPGRKDPERVKQFLSAARDVEPAR
jgi:phosphoribosylanthranilate isomerase